MRPQLCILCAKPMEAHQSTDEEHIFPVAIGGTIAIPRPVHKACNGRLGTNCDSKLVDHPLIQILRHQLQIKGRSGPPNPLHRRKMTNSDGHLVRYEPDSGFRQEREVFRSRDEVLFRTEGDPEGKRLVKIVQDFFAKEGLPQLSPQQILHNARRQSKSEQINVEFPIDDTFYKLGILKVIYELAVLWLGDRYLADPMARRLRSALFDEKQDPTLQKYQLLGDIGPISSDSAIDYPWSPFEGYKDQHLAILIRQRHFLVCAVKIFDVFYGILSVSERAGLYGFAKHEGRFLSVNPVAGNYKDCSLQEELMRQSRSLKFPSS